MAAVVVVGIEPGWTKKVADGIRESGKPVAAFSIERNGDLRTAMQAAGAAKQFLQDASELTREECGIGDLWVSLKCGESDTTSGLGSCPTVGNLVDKLTPLGMTSCFGETSELTGAEEVCRKRAATQEIGDQFHLIWKAYMDEVIEPHKNFRPFRKPADQRQHRRRLDYD